VQHVTESTNDNGVGEYPTKYRTFVEA